MRRTIITEDMISRALNESIDEFMLEEGAWDGLKNWFNKLGNTKFMRGLNNAVNMYMDYKTNGQWNREYNSYANDGNSKTVEMYYLDKWLKYHLGQMQYIEERSKSPNNAYDEIDWEKDENGKKIGKQRRLNYKTVKEYAENNITSEAFNLWIRNYIPDRQALKLIDEYIDTYCNKVENLRQANDIFDSNSFLTSDIGKEYTKAKSSELNRYDFNGQYKAKIDQQKADAEQKQREAEVNETKKCHEGINAILSSIGENIIKHTKPVSTSLVNSEIQYVEGRAAYYIPNKEIKDAFINWFSESLREYQQNLSKLKKHLNLNDFLAKYPKYKI